MSWKLRAREVCRETIAANPGADWPTMKTRLDAAYPFGMRKYTPYKLWLEERAKALSEYASMIGDAAPDRRVCRVCRAGLGRRCRPLDGEPIEGDYHAVRRREAAPSGPLFAELERKTDAEPDPD